MKTFELNTLVIMIILIGALGLILSIALMKKQEQRQRSMGMNKAIAKHPISLNPMLIAYFLFPILIVLGVLIFYGFNLSYQP